jgi:hypothetical protein
MGEFLLEIEVISTLPKPLGLRITAAPTVMVWCATPRAGAPASG